MHPGFEAGIPEDLKEILGAFEMGLSLFHPGIESPEIDVVHAKSAMAMARAK